MTGWYSIAEVSMRSPGLMDKLSSSCLIGSIFAAGRSKDATAVTATVVIVRPIIRYLEVIFASSISELFRIILRGFYDLAMPKA